MEHQDNSSEPIEKFLYDLTNEKPRPFSIEELMSFTSNLEKKLGFGGFGDVYKGKLSNGVKIAVKVLKDNTNEIMRKQFMAEVSTMGRTSHPNLIKLYGFCFDSNMKALVYEYMKNGSLDTLLFTDTMQIDWIKLYDIATEIANGLSYLHEHCRPRIIHYDIKPGNVLLDSNLSPKIIDFGLARHSNKDISQVEQSGFRGTNGCAAPEVGRGRQVTHKSDVYSYGMMLFEILRRKRNSMGPGWFPGEVAERVEQDQLDKIVMDCGIVEKDRANAKHLSIVALWCTQQKPQNRPDMSSVVKMLQGVIPLQKPSNPFPFYDSSPESSMFGGSTRIEDHRALPKFSSAITQVNSPSTSAALARIRAAARSYNKIKLLLIGKYGVGKRLLHRRFISADSKSDSSLAQNIFHTTMKIQLDEKPIELEVWSMPVEEEYRSLYVYTKVLGIFLVYDITDESSFNNIKNCISEVQTYARDNVYKILVGNKADKGESERVVSTSKGQALANEYGIKFFETSALKNLNVMQVFLSTVRDMKQRLLNAEEEIQFSPPPNPFLYIANAPGIFLTSSPAFDERAMAAARAKQFEVQLFLLGDRGVGKRSLRVRYSSSNYRSPRWSGDYFSIFEKIQIDEKLIELKIYHMKEDQGSESYNYPGTTGIILVYDLTNESTFNNIRDWIGDVKQYALHNVRMILVGNKLDLHTTKRAVPTSMGQALANEYGMKFFETSAKSYYNVEEAFLSITRDVIEIMEFTHLLRKSAFGNKK